MLINQRLNYNESLLTQSIIKSEQNLTNSSLHKRAVSCLHNQLNMAYSRLTEKRSDNIRELEIVQNYNIENKIQEDFIECQNCKHLTQYLFKLYKSLKELESKFIEKQLKLTQKYKQLWDQYQKMKKQSENYKKVSNEVEEKGLQFSSLFQQIKNFPKLQLSQNSNKKLGNEDLSENKTNKFLESTKGSEQRRKILKTTNTINFSDLIHSKDEILQKQNDQKLLFRSTGSQMQLSYSQSQRSPKKAFNNKDEFIKTSQFIKKSQKFSNFQPKKKNSYIFNKTQHHQLNKLRFQNSNLKSYNEVLLNHIKPKTLASKIFNF